LALQVIEKTLRGDELQAALNVCLTSRPMSDPDRHLVTQLAYGYFRYQLRLEHILGSFLTRSRDSLPRQAVAALCLGIYEICFLDRIPEYASVHWYVQQIKKGFSSKLGGVANAVLRRACREKLELIGREFYARDNPDWPAFLGRYYACPAWMVDLCLQAFGAEHAEAVLASSLAPPPVGLRFNPWVPGWSELYSRLATQKTVIACTSRGLAQRSVADREIRGYEKQGLITRQSLAAQLALDQEHPWAWSRPVWDACAGRGLKTGHLLESGCTDLWASDVHVRKVFACRQELARLSLPEIPLCAADAAKPPWGRRPQTILLDVPCSGLGVLSRRPDIKAKRAPQDLDNLIRLQTRLLTSCLSALPRGGRLVYISCTVNPAENDDLIRTVLEQNPGLGRLISMHPPNPATPFGEYFFSASIEV
jgi:16S rRNA (cytosine967-C5)-methyltransferase